MPLGLMILVLALVGVGLYFFNCYVTMIDGKMKALINFVVIAACVIWVLEGFGVFRALNEVHVGM